MRRQGINLIEGRGAATRATMERAGKLIPFELPATRNKRSGGSGQRNAPTIRLCLLGAWFLAGCQAYHSQPLPEVSDLKFEPAPGIGMMELLVTEIKHPILRPVRLDPNEGLTPEVAGVLAVMLNPSLRAVRDERAVADAQLLKAGLLPDPELSYDFETPIGGDTERTVNGFGLGINWDVTSLLARSANVLRAETHRLAVEADIAWQEWQTAQAAKTAVFAWVSLQGRIALQEQARQYLARNAELVREATANGTLMAKDLSAAESAGRQAEAALLDLRKQAQQQRLQLNRLLGLPPESIVRISNKIELPSSFKPPDEAKLLWNLEQRRLDLLALRRGYDNQEAAVRAAVLNQFPRITIGPTIGRDVEDVDTAGFGIGINLPILNRNQGNIAIEQATRQKLYDEYMNRLFEARYDVVMLLSRIQFLNDEIVAARQTQAALTKLEESYRAILAAGRVDILTYYAAWNDMANSRMRLLMLREQLAEAIIALELATGLYQIPEQIERKETQP